MSQVLSAIAWPTAENIEMPLLYWLATWDPMQFSRGELDDLIIQPLADLYNLSASDREELKEVGKHGKKKKHFYHEVLLAKLNLDKKKGYVSIQPRFEWKLTPNGIAALRAFCATELESLSEADQSVFRDSRDEMGRDLFLNALSKLPPESIAFLIQNQNHTRHKIMAEAVRELPIEGFCSFVCSMAHERELLFRRHIQRYRRP